MHSCYAETQLWERGHASYLAFYLQIVRDTDLALS